MRGLKDFNYIYEQLEQIERKIDDNLFNAATEYFEDNIIDDDSLQDDNYIHPSNDLYNTDKSVYQTLDYGKIH